ncbi:hypothetical protein [Desulforamulus aquiferis]|uniref:Uncharacterized protein n=1 Tax=Desulforamulus aquiferis TaxID=1397668 RepID=A0AAW7ZA59_9FIRM|nr:hypothetical protein [Desulforamulus aquiferis]MDO7786593.1 hypothetical protein [Desulforamulus aquiferis]RYD05790.1 hypothetical protein N752_07810 [Desulforamulus aquiferis]
MNKGVKTAVLAFIILAFLALGTKPLWLGNGLETAEEVSKMESIQGEPVIKELPEGNKAGIKSLAQLLDDSFATGKPVMVVYTYNADC